MVLLDEPVAHLDSVTAREVLDDLLAASSDRTLVMVSHGRMAGTASPGPCT